MTHTPLAESPSDAPPRPLVEEAVRAFTKAFRAWQLYLPNNPTRERAISTARLAFEACWGASPETLRLQVREAEFLCDGRVVFSESDRPSDSIPWLLYRDGVREISFTFGFQNEELSEFLGLLQRARQAAPDDDDLVTMLWVADFECVQYRYVEVASAYAMAAIAAASGLTSEAASSTDAETAIPLPLATPLAESSTLESPPTTSGVLRMEDFDSTLYFLDPKELTYLRDEVKQEFRTDARERVLTILFDLLEHEPENAHWSEILDDLDELLIDLLSTGAYTLVAMTLREAGQTAKRQPSLPEMARTRLLGFADRLSEPAVVAQLLQAIDEGSRAPQPITLESLVSELRGSALAPLLAWLAHASPGAARTAIERAVQRLAERQSADLVRLLDDADADTATGAVRLSGQLRTAAAVPSLTRQLSAASIERRLDLVEALAAIASPGALRALEPMVEDADRDVRVAALRVLGTLKHAAVLPRLTVALRRKELREADRSEKAALFEAYGTLCGDAGVATLDGVLNGRSFLGPRESPEMRACAARALALVGTEAAVVSIRKAASAKDPVVRNEVSRALRGVSR